MTFPNRLLAFALLGLLAACVPAAAEERVEIAQLSSAVSFYPQEAGALWEYLPTGARLNDTRLVQAIEGPTVVSGDLWIVSREVGLGLDNRWYRQYRPDGVFLQREIRPGQQIIYEPPVQEFPPEADLRVGATWGGETRVTVYYPDADPEQQYQTHQTEYRYTVVDEREVSVQAGSFFVFVIDFEARFLNDEREVLETVKLTTWFTPYLGEVKDEHDLFLVATNVPLP